MQPDYILLYVNDAPASAAFYASLLGLDPVESSPAYAMFRLDSGVKLGLWTRSDVLPPLPDPVAACGGGTELAFSVSSDAKLQTCHAEWSARGLPIIQAPTAMEFGLTFVALDPDQHRVRVFAPGCPA